MDVAPLLALKTPAEACKDLAERARVLRLGKGWTRATLAIRAGVSSASLKRFETMGAASLDLVLRVAFALGRLEDFTAALQLPEANSLAELRGQNPPRARRRGRL